MWWDSFFGCRTRCKSNVVARENLRGKINAGDLRSPLHIHCVVIKICAVNIYAVTSDKAGRRGRRPLQMWWESFSVIEQSVNSICWQTKIEGQDKCGTPRASSPTDVVGKFFSVIDHVVTVTLFLRRANTVRPYRFVAVGFMF